MSDFEERLNSILNDPNQMDRIAAMAKSLMGGESEAVQAPKPSMSMDLPDIGRLMASFGGSGGGKSDNKRALLEAMKPYLSPHRREKLDRAMKLARMIGMAETAFGLFGGDHAEI